LNSAVATTSYTVQVPQAATPTFSEGTGTYTGTQSITLSDTTSGATIYYAINATPTTSSTKYTTGTPITVSTSETVEAMAVATGYTQSAVASATYTITTQAAINYASFTSSSGLSLNGGPMITSANRLRLTDGGALEARSAFFTTPVNVQAFTNDFSFQLTNANADGFTFTIQDNSSTIVGPPGSGLGYGAYTPTSALGIPLSVAVKCDLYNNDGEGSDSTGMYTDGASPTVPAVDMTSSGVNLHSGDIMNVHMTYDGTTLTWTITDAATGASFSDSVAVNIPSTVGSSTAYVGFTASTGGASSIQEILSWTYASSGQSESPAATPTFSEGTGTYTGTQSITLNDATSGATIYYAINATPTTSSTKYTAGTPITVSTSETLEAIAVATGYTQSNVASATYTINPVTTSTITYVQGTYTNPLSGNPATATYALAQTAGDLNVVVIGWYDTTSTISSVTDSKGNTYTLAVGPTQMAGDGTNAIYYAKNIAGATAGTNTVTVTFSQTVSYPDLRVVEYSGADTVNPLDAKAAGTGNSAVASSGPLTTTSTNDILVAGGYVYAFVNGAGSGFTNRMYTPDGDNLEDELVPATGTYTATASLSASAMWIMQCVAFRPPSL
jgi:hypothetical protein